MHRIILSITVTLVSFFAAMAQDHNHFEKSLFVAGADTLPYRLLRPIDMREGNKYPLVLFLHGAGERGHDNEVQIRHISALFLDENNRRQYPAFVLAPQCPVGHVWSNFSRNGNEVLLKPTPSKPTKMLIALLEKLCNELPVDSERIYLVGLSMGGYGAWDLVARLPDQFAAAVPVCGGGAPNSATDIKHVPIWAFHGRLDKVVHPRESRKMIDALHAAGGSPRYTEYPAVEHNSWTYAFKEPDLLPWLFEKRLPEPPK